MSENWIFKRLSWSVAKALLIALPCIFTGYLIFKYGVDVPYWDQWEGTATLFEKEQAGSLVFNDFFVQHNEHRILFPRLIAYSLAKLTHWNIGAESMVIWLLAAVSAFSVYKICRSSNPGSLLPVWVLFAINVLIFTPLNVHNWLWGFQIGFLLPVALTTTCIWVASSFTTSSRFVYAMMLCVASTFSIGGGFMLWLIATPLLFCSEVEWQWKRRRSWWILWFSVFLTSILLYFYGYVKPAQHPSLFEAFSKPFQAIGYVLLYLGSAFSSGTNIDSNLIGMVAGGVMVSMLLFLVCYLWVFRVDRLLIKQTIPSVMLASYAVINAGLTMVGRLGFGLGQAASSRYTIFSILLPVALLLLIPVVFRHWKTRRSDRTSTDALKLGMCAVVSVLAFLHALAAVNSLKAWPATQRERLTARAFLAFVNVVDEPDYLAAYLTYNLPPLKERASVLSNLGYLRPPLAKSNSLKDISNPSMPASASFGKLQEAGMIQDGLVGFRGWAVIPDKSRPADAVLLTYDDKGEARVFAISDVGIPQEDVVKTSGETGFLRSGWLKRLTMNKLPAGAKVINAWAYDAEANHAFLMDGFVKLQGN
jgi:hypothetical protein